MLELLLSALLQISLLSDPTSTPESKLDKEQQTELSSSESTTSSTSTPDPRYGGGTSWDDND